MSQQTTYETAPFRALSAFVEAGHNVGADALDRVEQIGDHLASLPIGPSTIVDVPVTVAKQQVAVARRALGASRAIVGI